MADLIKVADAWEKTRRGNDAGTYIVAVAGGMKFLLLRKNRAAENGSTWTLFVTERTPRQDQRRSSESSRPAGPGAGVLAGAARATEPLVVEPIPRGGDEIPF
jgi:hypothetical protein